MKRCPRCSEPLYRRRVAAIEVDGCPLCGGLWLDQGELKALAQDPSMLRAAGDQFVPQQWVASPQATQRCPACEQPLTQLEYDQFRGVRLDRCKACGGIWLDHGEAAEIARRLEAGDSAPAAPPAHAPAAPADGGSGLELAEIPRPPPSPPLELPGAPAAGPHFDPGRALASQGLDARREWTLNRSHLLPVGIAAVVGLVLYLFLRQDLIEAGDDAAHLPVTTLSTQRTLGDFQGKPVFIRFVTSAGPAFTCPNTIRAAQNERALTEKFADKVTFLSIDIDAPTPSAERAGGWELASFAGTNLYHQFFEKKSYGCRGVAYSFPAYVILDRDGRVTFSGQGNKPLPELESLIAEAL